MGKAHLQCAKAVSYTHLDVYKRQVLEAVILAIKNVLDFMTLGSCPLERVSFAFARPAYAGLAHQLCRCEVRYDADWSGFVLPAQSIDQPLKTRCV